MTTIARGWDAAFCPDPAPDLDEGYEWQEVYIGGSSATRRDGWNTTEVNRVADRPSLPVWVPTPGVDNPRQTALSCIRACQAYGVPDHATPWRAVLWDLETGTEPDPPWFAAARTVMEAHGYASMSYGSSGWAFGEPNYLGLVIALPGTSFTLDQVRAAHVGHLIAGIQDRFGVKVPGGVIDTDQLDAAWLPHLGHLKLG